MVLSMQRWVGKIAVVTGASSGIGAAIATALVEHGLIVVGLARRVDRINERSKELSGKKGRLYGVKVDLTVEQEILDAFKWIEDNLGHVHILVNNAGFMKEELLTEGTTETWKRIIDVNVLSLCIATREAIKSVSPGLVTTEMTVLRSDFSEEKRRMYESRPILNTEDIADGVVYVLSTPEHVQVHELTIKPLGEPY